jgi:lipid-A-disaccharide synthase
MDWNPDVVILVDYPGFNLDIAKYVHRQKFKVYYYISPKIWAWKEYRIKRIKRDVDELFSILPFEVEFFEGKHHYPIHYVGNPTAQEVRDFLASDKHGLGRTGEKAIIALLAGSRKQEIKDNLPAMIEATRHLDDRYDIVLAGAPSIPSEYYEPFLKGSSVRLVMNETYPLLARAVAALVTSGTATLETALLGTPQVACYRFNGSKWSYNFYRRLLTGKYVTLPNLITDEPVIPELLMHLCTVDSIDRHLTALLGDTPERTAMLDGYRRLAERLGTDVCTMTAARLICSAHSSF